MSHDGPVGLIRSAVALLNVGNLDGYLRHFAPTCPRWIAGLERPLSVTEVGDNLRLLHAAFDPLRLHEDLLFGDDRFVCARWRLGGVHTGAYMGIEPTQREISTQTCEIYELEGDLVVATWTYGDLGELFQQIGAPSN